VNSRFHSRLDLSLDVESLNDSIDFYAALFGMPPIQVEPDYAVFDVQRPELRLTLQRKMHCCLQGLNHMGLRVGTMDEVEGVKTRLMAAGFPIRNELDVPNNGKRAGFWVRDPSKYRWEVRVMTGSQKSKSDLAS
jgi:catechol 2,3-dioxygenase-like lactoylglutathione lyase family enzyme